MKLQTVKKLLTAAVPIIAYLIFEIFKKIFPQLSGDEKLIALIIIVFLAAVIFVIFLMTPILDWLISAFRKRQQDTIYDPKGRYGTDTVGLVQQYMENNGLNIDGLVFNQKVTIGDLTKHASNHLNASFDTEKIRELTQGARAFAYRNKYSEPSDEDEKVFLKDRYGIWTKYLDSFLLKNDIRLVEFYNSNILDVGFGHGYAYANVDHFEKFKKFTAIDISKKALENSANNFSGITTKVGVAEKLPIETSSIDLYFSFRTFQSTLFDRRAAIHEAERVLKFGGLILISIPILYVDSQGEIKKGLSPGYKRKPTLNYAQYVVDETKLLLEMVGFKNISDSKKHSPFEIFILARR